MPDFLTSNSLMFTVKFYDADWHEIETLASRPMLWNDALQMVLRWEDCRRFVRENPEQFQGSPMLDASSCWIQEGKPL